MKKTRKFVAAILAVIMLATVFTSCGTNVKNEGSSNGEGGSDIAAEASQSPETTEAQTTAAPKPKYSSSDKLIALTFDDGPSASITNKVLDLLEENGGVATFFLVGTNIENNVETIKRAHELGCEIANHTKSHKNLTRCSSDEIRTQVDTPNELLSSLAGIEPVLFRAPGGNFKGVEDEIGMPIIQWSIDTNDWRYKDAAHPNRSESKRNEDLNRIANDVIDNAEKGDIVLMHDIYEFTGDLCEIIIPGLVAKGFKLVTVSEMLEAYGVESEAGKVYYSVDANIIDAEPLTPGSYKVKTNGGMLNIREEADSNSASLAKISNGESVYVLRAVKGWAFVSYGETQGWVNASFLEQA